jgi:TonB-linked SusC/RagA family outer membrane protein
MNMKYAMKFSLLITILLILNDYLCLGQDDYTITGKIVNSNNHPVSGVSVTVEGAGGKQHVTGNQGTFELETTRSVVWLSISPVDQYKNKRKLITSVQFDSIKIYLTELGMKSGEDEILSFTGETKRRNQVSPLYTIEDYEYNRLPYVTTDQYFQGKVPGSFFTNHSGMPGTGGALFLRGLNSIHANNTPLFVVDGLPMENASLYTSLVEGNAYNPLANIEQQDIANVTILNGGTGASLYGVKGSNGVVLIETLKPTDIQTSINFSFRAGLRMAGKQLPQLNSQQYKTLVNEILSTSDMLNEQFNEEYPGLYASPGDDNYIRYSHDYNWQDEIFTNSMFQDAYLNVKGGDAIGKYGLSIGYFNHKGIYHNSGFDRFTARFVGTFNVFEWLRFNVSANLATVDSEVKESALTRQTNPILTSLFKSPLMFPLQYDDNNNQLSTIDEVDELGVSNPKAVMENYEAKNANSRFLTSVRIEGDITNAIQWNSLLGLNINSLRQTAFYPNRGMELYDGGEAYNISNSITNNLLSIYNDNYLSYAKEFNKHHFSARIGAKWFTNSFEEDIGLTKNANENDEYRFLNSGTAFLREIGGGVYNWNWLSGYGTINYAFLDRYIFEAGISGDLSSNVGENSEKVLNINNIPFGVFYSAGLAWRISGEQFMHQAGAIDDLKIRFQYGKSGNDDIGMTSRQDYYRIALYRETSGMVPAGYGNDELKYEENSQYTTGIDLAFLGNRYRLSMSYFNMDVNDLLIYEELNSYLGYDVYPSNNASITKNGIELNLFAQVLRTSNFKADIMLNLTTTRNEVTSVKNDKLVTEVPGFEVINTIGSPVNSYYGYNFKGVFSTEEEAKEANLVNDIGLPFGPGDAIYEDISGPEGTPDGVINDHDKTVLGSSSPDMFGGVTIRIGYKKWGIETMMQYVTGNDLFNYIRYQNEKMTDLSNQSITALRRWSYEGQQTDIPRALWNDPVGNTAFSSRWIEDGSYMRWKYITLSYNPKANLWFFRDFNVFITGLNLLTFTDYLGYDPEFSHSPRSLIQGADYGLMPNARTFMLGVELGL